MFINYSNLKINKNNPSIFLAGPTTRGIEQTPWRQEAIKILQELNFNGVVYYPETENKKDNYDYVNQTEWEREALFNADIIIFWIPRKLPENPAFTTNVEFGYWMAKNSSKVLYGRPENSEKNKYLDWLYTKETKRIPENNLKNLLEKAISIMHM